MQPVDLPLLELTYVAGSLSAEQRRRLEQAFSIRLVRAGDTIVRRGETADAWQLIQAGNARAVGSTGATAPTVFGPGDGFGAAALIENVDWPWTLRAESSVTLATLPRHAFDAFTATLEPPERADLGRRIAQDADFDFLRRLRLFSTLTRSDLERLFDRLIGVSVARGQHLFHEDDAGEACYIIRSGRIQLLKNVAQSQKHLAIRREGDLIGEIELLYGTARMADAVAATDTDLFKIGKDVFDELIPEGGIRQVVFRLATERLLQYQNALAEVDRRAAEGGLPTLTVRWNKPAGGRLAPAFPFVAADSPPTSGVACLAMLDAFHGRDTGWQDHLEQFLWDRQADSLMSFSRKAEACGYLTHLVALDPDQLRRVALPAVVEDDDGTLATLFRATRKTIVLANPCRGVRAVAADAFAPAWRGRALLLTPVPRKLGPALLRSWAPCLAGVIIASLLLAILGLSAPLATKLIIDRVLVDGDRSILRLLLIGMLAIVAFRLASGALREHLIAHVTRRLTLFLQVRFLDHILRLPHRTNQHVGEFAVGFRENERLVTLAFKAGLPLVVDSLAVLFALAALFAISVPLALVALAFVTAYGVVALAFGAFVPRVGGRSVETKQALQTHLIEAVAGIATIKSLATEHLFLGRGMKLLLKLNADEFAATRLQANRELTGTVLHLAATAAILGYGAALTLAGHVTTGGMVASLGIFATTLVPINSLLDARGATRDLRSSFRTIQALMGLATEESAGAAVAPLVQGHIALRNLSFRYPGGAHDVLSEVNLEILPGQTVAFVGRSGSGKTTLVNLLLGLYQPTRGAVHVDHVDVSGIPKPALRRQYGVVEQHPFLFKGTIRDNIAKADPSATLERVEAAAKLAGAHDFIQALTSGYDTPIGDRGVRLSGGEKQRLMIARALVGDPRVLILDEATSALDSGAEREIHRNIAAAHPGRTTILIAHRFSTLRRADLIVVLDRGRVVETGTHADLMTRQGLYYFLTTRSA